MAEYTIIKKDGKKFKVTTNDSKRQTVRSSSGFGSGGNPTLYNKKTGRRDFNANIQETNNDEVVKQIVDLKASEPIKEPEVLEPVSVPVNEQYYYNYLADGGVNQGTQPQQENIKVNIPIPLTKGVYEEYKKPEWFNQEGFKEDIKKPFSYSSSIPSAGLKNFNFGRVKTEFNELFNPAYSDPQLKPLAQIGQGFGLSVIGAGEGVTSLATNPVGTVSTLTKGDTYSKLIAEEKLLASTEPSIFLGKRLGDIFLFKAPELAIKGTVKVRDYRRTAGRTEVPLSDLTTPEIVAQLPEQKYPYYGETPSELVSSAYGSSPYVAKAQELFLSDLKNNPLVTKKVKPSGVDELTNYMDSLAKELLRDNNKKPITFTVSPAPIQGGKVKTKAELRAEGFGTSETPIISSAPYVATTYAKIGYGDSQVSRITSNNIFDLLKSKPQVTAIISESVVRPPLSVLSKAKSLSYKEGTNLLSDSILKTQKQGQTYTAPTFELGKLEAEFGTFAGQEFTRINPVSGTKYYTQINGRRVPLDAISLDPKLLTGTPEAVPSLSLGKSNKITYESVIKGSEDLSSTVNVNYNYPKSVVPSSSSPSSSASNNLFDSSNLMVLNPSSSKVTPSISVSPYTNVSGSISVSSVPSSSSVSNSVSPSISYPSVIPSSSSGSKSRSDGSKSSSSSPSSSSVPSSSSSSPSSSSVPSSSGVPKPSSSIITPPPRIYGGYVPFSNRKTPKAGYNVLVRSKGIFRKENVKPLSKQDALNFGSFRVGTSASATFKLEKTSGNVISYKGAKGKLSDFYTKNDLFIEKRGRRIKSLGELKEITYKGIATNKARGKSPFSLTKTTKKKGKKKKGIWGF